MKYFFIFCLLLTPLYSFSEGECENIPGGTNSFVIAEKLFPVYRDLTPIKLSKLYSHLKKIPLQNVMATVVSVEKKSDCLIFNLFNEADLNKKDLTKSKLKSIACSEQGSWILIRAGGEVHYSLKAARGDKSSYVVIDSCP